jgi:hypothetical protein
MSDHRVKAWVCPVCKWESYSFTECKSCKAKLDETHRHIGELVSRLPDSGSGLIHNRCDDSGLEGWFVYEWGKDFSPAKVFPTPLEALEAYFEVNSDTPAPAVDNHTQNKEE